MNEPEGIALDCGDGVPISGSVARLAALAHAWQWAQWWAVRLVFETGPRRCRHDKRARGSVGWGSGTTSALITWTRVEDLEFRAALVALAVSAVSRLETFFAGFVLVSLPHRAASCLVTWGPDPSHAGCVASPCGQAFGLAAAFYRVLGYGLPLVRRALETKLR